MTYQLIFNCTYTLYCDAPTSNLYKLDSQIHTYTTQLSFDDLWCPFQICIKKPGVLVKYEAIECTIKLPLSILIIYRFNIDIYLLTNICNMKLLRLNIPTVFWSILLTETIWKIDGILFEYVDRKYWENKNIRALKEKSWYI